MTWSVMTATVFLLETRNKLDQFLDMLFLMWEFSYSHSIVLNMIIETYFAFEWALRRLTESLTH